ncbi:dehydrogenase [Solibacillus silvestris]|uniref:dehydrogenase n=1 Tax=Solibacillus silvestris TaxID=76853 RepID=UPI003F800388
MNEQTNSSEPVDQEQTDNKENENDDQGGTKSNEVQYELLFQLDSIPPEVGTSISIVQDEKLYTAWAEIFGFDSVPAIDFETEEALFVTAYSDGCGRELEYIDKEEETLIIKLNYHENIRKKDEIACTDIALPNTYVVKMEKTDTKQGKLIDINRTSYEDDSIVQDKLQ